jgi:glycosyltransferase involved in cell wall biosynthesis
MAAEPQSGAEARAPIRPAVLIPVFNNARTIRQVAERALAVIPDVLVVDDGSTDGTAAEIAALGDRVRLLRHPRNLGKGRALRDGFAALRPDFSHAVAVDADGQHFPEDLPRFLAEVARTPEAILVGERDMKTAGAPRRSLFGLWFSNRCLRWLGKVKLRDTQCGFRAYPLAGLAGLDLRGDRYDFELEVLLKAARAGIPIRAVPVEVAYRIEGGRVSHFRPVRDFLQIAGRVARIVAGREG